MIGLFGLLVAFVPCGSFDCGSFVRVKCACSFQCVGAFGWSILFESPVAFCILGAPLVFSFHGGVASVSVWALADFLFFSVSASWICSFAEIFDISAVISGTFFFFGIRLAEILIFF